MRRISPGLLIILTLNGCHKAEAPKDMAVMTLPAPPQAGQVALYAAPNGISVQSHTDDCVKTPCFVYRDNHWQALPAQEARQLPLLTLNGATGSAYSETLWRDAGQERAVLINDAAARDAASHGQFDGLRIGLKQAGRVSYLTVFGAPEAAIALSGGGAWLLAQRKDGSSVLINLFSLQGRTQVTCAGDVAIDTAPWAGVPETALSPDVFAARNISAEARTAEKARIAQTCATGGANLKRQP